MTVFFYEKLEFARKVCQGSPKHATCLLEGGTYLRPDAY